MSKLQRVVVLASAVTFLCTGCSIAQKNIPHIGFGTMSLEADLQRSDITVLDRVEGESTRTFICFGLVQIIDGDKLQIIGIKFFKDKFTFMDRTTEFRGLGIASTFDRAYYKALEAHPDADAVFVKGIDREEGGVPLLWRTESVTVKGKALKINPNK